MKENPDQDKESVDGSHVSPLSERTSRSADRASKLVFTQARWWLTVKRRAPAHLAKRNLCCAFGSRANWNVTARERTSPMCEKIGIVGREATAPSKGTRCDTGRETISDGDTPVQRLAEYDNSVSD